MNNDLISREALKKVIETYRPVKCFTDKDTGKNRMVDYCLSEIDNAPTVLHDNYCMGYQDGVRKVLSERPQGEWYFSCEKGWECNQCHEVVKDMPTCMRKAIYNFCPNCGADMKKGEEE